MKRKMSFLPELQEFLKENKLIYTIRKYDMDERDVEIEGVGICHRKPLGKIEHKESLGVFVKSSGFDSLQAWLQKVKLFSRPGDDLYLYEVTYEH